MTSGGVMEQSWLYLVFLVHRGAKQHKPRAVRSCLRMLRDLYQPGTGCTAQLATVRSALVLLEHRGEEGAWDR